MKTFRALVVGLLVGLACTVVGGQVSAPSTISINDEGVIQGRVRSINFVGSGVLSTVVAGQAVVTIAGGGSVAMTEIEIDFGAPGCGTTVVGDLNSPDHCETTITDAAVSATSKIIALQAGIASSTLDQDENDMDQFTCWANPGTGNFVLFCRGIDNQELYGKHKVWYIVG